MEGGPPGARHQPNSPSASRGQSELWTQDLDSLAQARLVLVLQPDWPKVSQNLEGIQREQRTAVGLGLKEGVGGGGGAGLEASSEVWKQDCSQSSQPSLFPRHLRARHMIAL